MRFSFAMVALAVSSASAALVARQLPSCANDCLFGPSVDLDGCSPRDNVCLCKSKTFVSKSTACIENACSGKDLATAISAAQQLCLSVGVTLTEEPPAETQTASATETSDVRSSTSDAPHPTNTAPTSSGPASETGSGSATGTAAPAEISKTNAARVLGAQAAAVLGVAFGVAALAL